MNNSVFYAVAIVLLLQVIAYHRCLVSFEIMEESENDVSPQVGGKNFDMNNIKKVKPLYIKNGDLIKETNTKKGEITSFEISRAVLKVVEVGDIIGITEDRDLWRIYLINNECRVKVAAAGICLRGQYLQLFSDNPYSTGISSPDEECIKITVRGLPLSVGNEAIKAMLAQLGVKLNKDLRYGQIRDPETNDVTGILNGDRYTYTDISLKQNPLPRHHRCAGLKCRIYHWGQPTVDKASLFCTNCLDNGHVRSSCRKGDICRACKQSGHEPGSTDCPSYGQSKTVEAFRGHEDVLSNFYASEVKVFGVPHATPEHSFQYTKLIKCGKIDMAKKVTSAPNALVAKRLAREAMCPREWDKENVAVMEEILQERAHQDKAFYDKLVNSKKDTIFVEATPDLFWGSGLFSKEQTINTKAEHWPGANKLGVLLANLAKELKTAKQTVATPARRGGRGGRRN